MTMQEPTKPIPTKKQESNQRGDREYTAQNFY